MPTLQPPYQAPSQVAPGIWLAPIPIPIPLKYVNCYLCQGPTGWTLVDTGFHDALAEAAWPQVFADLSIQPREIDRILVTHYHPDHLGGAGWLQQLTGAPVFLHGPELEQARLFWGTDATPKMARWLAESFRAEGMPAELSEAITQHHLEQFERVRPLPEFNPIPTGSRFRIGAAEYETLWMPGHSDGLAVFWNAESGLLFANDMLLNKITPNVSLWPKCRPNPLEDYLASLARVEALQAKLGLPGHRTLITDVTGRAREIRQHHAERLDRMERLCDSVRGATAWEVCQAVFRPEELTVHQVRFAMSETLAHLVYMEKQGRLLRREGRFVQA